MSKQWMAALDAFADHLADQRAAIDHGLPPRIRRFRPPVRRGPLPEAVWHLAETLLEEADELERQWARTGAAASADAPRTRLSRVSSSRTSTAA